MLYPLLGSSDRLPDYTPARLEGRFLLLDVLRASTCFTRLYTSYASIMLSKILVQEFILNL